MNIYDISEHARVSIATVSRVLSGDPDVSGKIGEEVLKVMDELSYTPSVSARGLGLNTMRTIGTICSDSSNLYLAGTICYLERGLRAYGYNAILYCTGYDLDAKQKYFGLLRSKRVGAIILAGSKFAEIRAKDNAYIIEVAFDLPIMLVNSFLEDKNIYSTVCNDHAATYDATSRLLSSGRRRVLYAYTSYSYNGVNKLEGYKDALKTEGITPSDGFIHQCPKDIETTRELLLSLYREGLEFSAVITSDDSLAVGAVKRTYMADVSIPRDLSVIGYNNSLLARRTDPEITFIDSKVGTLCTTTTNTLTGVFNGVSMPNRTTIASDLIKRRTTNFQFLRRSITHETIYGQGFLIIN